MKMKQPKYRHCSWCGINAINWIDYQGVEGEDARHSIYGYIY